jgi:hypothetical protein
MSGDGDMYGDGDNGAPVYGISPDPTGGATSTGGALIGSGGAPVYGAPPTGGDANLGGMGGETSSGGATGGAVEEGTGGDQLIPVYGLAPRR